MILLIAALAAQASAPLHTPLDRAVTAEHVYIECLVTNARRFTRGRAAPNVAVNGARRFCRAEYRVLNDVHRDWNRSRGQGRRGLSAMDARLLLDLATARLTTERGGEP